MTKRPQDQKSDIDVVDLLERHRDKIEEVLGSMLEQELGDELSFEEYERKLLQIMNELSRQHLEKKLQGMLRQLSGQVADRSQQRLARDP